jgi:hypothetical protein
MHNTKHVHEYTRPPTLIGRIGQTPQGAPILNDPNFTVEEASRWLTCAQPVDLKILQQLGRDCSMLSKVRKIEWTLRPTPGKAWPNERAYPPAVIQEVFAANPNVKDYIPK